MEDLISREEALAGSPERQARNLLFAIENMSAEAEQRALQVTAEVAEAWDEEERDEAYIDAFRIARNPAAAPTATVLDRHSFRWRQIVPENPRLRAALAHVMAAKYGFTRRGSAGIRSALALESAPVRESYAALYGEDVETIYAPEKKVPLSALALTFLQLGVTSVGGKSTQTYLFQEFVRRRGWLASEDLAECYTLAKLLPGPTGANTSIAAAQVMRGPLAAVVCMLGFSLPGSLIMLALGAFLIGQQLPAWGEAALTGGSAAALGLLLASTLQMGLSSRRARWWPAFIVVAFVATALLKVSFALVILGLGAISLAVNRPKKTGAS